FNADGSVNLPTLMNDSSAVTSQTKHQVQHGGISSGVILKDGNAVCEDHPDCALLPQWTCIADDVIWDDCPKMCGQCGKTAPSDYSPNTNLPTQLNPGQLTHFLKPPNLPIPPSQNPTLPNLPLINQHMLSLAGLKQVLPAPRTVQQVALANLQSQLQREQLQLANLLNHQKIASLLNQQRIENLNPAQLLQPLYNKISPHIQRLIKPVTTLPLQGALPQQQCTCSQLSLPMHPQVQLQLPQPPLQQIIP
ncbi:unnamed protein product, partial [Meganyctiphanes norvegica]